MSKVSIILPIYNAEKTLARCLDSIFNQTVQDVQVIVINNGSKDETIEILKVYKNRFKDIKIINKVNGLMSVCKEMGVSLSDSKYICFLNQGDVLEYNFIEKMYNKIKKEKADIVFSDTTRINYLGSELLNGIKNNKKIDFSVVTDYTFIYNKIYRKEFIEKNNIEFTDKIYYDEFKYMIDILLKKPKMVYIKKPLYTTYERIDRSLISKKILEKKTTELFETLNSYKENKEEMEFICIEMFLYNSSEKLINIISIKNEMTNIFKVKYIYWKKNKYFKTKSFRYKFRCLKAYKRIEK